MRNICTYGFIPIRSEASECSEMVSQILFGETFEVLAEEGRWAKIRTVFDSYEGWIDRKLTYKADGAEVEAWEQATKHIVAPPYARATRQDNGVSMYLTPGSEVAIGGSAPSDDKSFSINGVRYELSAETESHEPRRLLETAMRFLGTPYLWGGRTFFGIDCSGFTQTTYKVVGRKLPRDASQQIELGVEVRAGSERLGDLAFFVNDKGRICHVGLCMGDGKIIHSSGSVRIDDLDDKGIFNHERGLYSHRLLTIKDINR